MIKINDIIPLINTSLKTHYFKDVTCYDMVAELIGQEGEDVTKRPAIYEGNGNYRFIQEDTKGLIIYHRLISLTNDEDQEKGFGRNSLTKETYEIKSVFYGQQAAIKTENEDINYLLAQEFKKLFPRTVTLSNKIRISVGGIELNKKTIEDEEGLETIPESVCFAITYTVVIMNTENCNELTCN